MNILLQVLKDIPLFEQESRGIPLTGDLASTSVVPFQLAGCHFQVAVDLDPLPLMTLA